MKVEKIITEHISWRVDENCCEKMEHAIADEFIFIHKGQTQLKTASPPYLSNGNWISYCPFCGEQIENNFKEITQNDN